MRHLKQWVNYNESKVPINPRTGGAASPTDPGTWGTYEEARARDPERVGFVFTEADPYFFFDIDHCAVDGAWNMIAQSALYELQGCHVEVSMSGTGLHIIGKIPPGVHMPHCNKNAKLGIEFYTRGRYCAMTEPPSGTEFTPPADAYQWVLSHFPAPTAATATTELTTGPVPEWNGPTADERLLELALGSQSRVRSAGFDDNMASFRELYERNEDVLGDVFPDGDQNRAFDWSGADAALCKMLAFWTGKDQTRMAKLWAGSELWRDKAAERHDYVLSTINHACNTCNTVAGSGTASPASPVAAAIATSQAITAAQEADPATGALPVFLQVSDYPEYFKGCVFISQEKKILLPNGLLSGRTAFDGEYSNRRFQLEDGGKYTGKSAWEAFISSTGFVAPKAHSGYYGPTAEPRMIVDVGGTIKINMYINDSVKPMEGDVPCWIRHMETMFPDDRDRKIVESYLAALTQYPGAKFRFCIAIQGVEGNGKTTITNVATQLVGFRNTGSLDPCTLGKTMFNYELKDKCLIVVDDAGQGTHKEKEASASFLKLHLTNDTVSITGKGRDSETCRSTSNFIITTNYKDGVVKTIGDRRYSIFFTGQPSKSDLNELNKELTANRDLDREYAGDGYAKIHNYYKQYKIEDAFNPTINGMEAPETTSSEEAISLTRSYGATAIEEAIENEVPGFCGDYVLSHEVTILLSKYGRPPGANTRAKAVKECGYIIHPALSSVKGRVRGDVVGSTVVYVRDGSVAAKMPNRDMVIGSFCEAQGYNIEDYRRKEKPVAITPPTPISVLSNRGVMIK